GTSLHTLVQMVENGLGLTLLPEMAIRGGILAGTNIVVRPIGSEHAHRDIALIWRRNSPREKEFRMMAGILRDAAEVQAVTDLPVTAEAA
ncbi:MAG: LysR substrate-binding domain-containing protein, partial [Sphingobium sp.]